MPVSFMSRLGEGAIGGAADRSGGVLGLLPSTPHLQQPPPPLPRQPPAHHLCPAHPLAEVRQAEAGARCNSDEARSEPLTKPAAGPI